MATAIGARVLYKTATGWIPAVILRAYSDAGTTAVDNAAETDTSITYADLLILGYQPTRLLAAKEVTVSGTDGSIAAGTNAKTTAASMTTGTWFNFS